MSTDDICDELAAFINDEMPGVLSCANGFEHPRWRRLLECLRARANRLHAKVQEVPYSSSSGTVVNQKLK
jgi:hypothetical protein